MVEVRERCEMLYHHELQTNLAEQADYILSREKQRLKGVAGLRQTPTGFCTVMTCQVWLREQIHVFQN